MMTCRTSIVILSLGLAACSGSGSSGFDIRSEAAAIEQALARQTCVTYNAVDYCPADATRAQDSGRIDTNLSDATDVACMPNADGTCKVSVTFAPEGFSPETVYLVASRTDADAPWVIAPPPVSSGSPEAPNFEGMVGLDPATAVSPDGTVQVAVLVFLVPPADVPASVAELANTGADFVFVTPAQGVLTPRAHAS
jgi:hypothetical protein